MIRKLCPVVGTELSSEWMVRKCSCQSGLFSEVGRERKD